MDFISNQEAQNKEMLQSLSLNSIEELLTSIPNKLKLPKVTFDDGLSEYEGLKWMEELSKKNSFSEMDSYLGAGAYEHYVPAIVSAICTKSEFLTSYTPYQAEASQGMLQAIFEYQTAICNLTGLDVSNASLYDGASACGEAVLMALRFQKEKNKILCAGNIHPHIYEVIQQYLPHKDFSLNKIAYHENGLLDFEAFEKQIDKETAVIVLQYPNFFGGIEDIQKFAKAAKEKGILTILSANPLIYGLFKNAKELGVDIAIGDGQPFGHLLQFGGPYVGYIACDEKLLRQLPGRIVGETTDVDGKRGFVLTLQAREQHIRREKATSNICTNQSLAALATLVALSWYGKEGVKHLALTNYQRAHYLKENLKSICSHSPFDKGEFFNEFVVKFKKPSQYVLNHFRKYKIEPGFDLSRIFPELKDHFLVAVTETKSLAQLNNYLEAAKSL